MIVIIRTIIFFWRKFDLFIAWSITASNSLFRTSIKYALVCMIRLFLLLIVVVDCWLQKILEFIGRSMIKIMIIIFRIENLGCSSRIGDQQWWWWWCLEKLLIIRNHLWHLKVRWIVGSKPRWQLSVHFKRSTLGFWLLIILCWEHGGIWH